MTNFDLATLPKPQVIKELDYEAIVSRQNTVFQTTWASVRAANPDLPTYDVEMLETDPAVIGNQSESARELLLRADINDAVRATLLAFATGGDLEHLAAFYDVERMDGELDDRLKTRIVLAIQGRSTGGPPARYRYVAMTADIRVESAIAYRDGRSPIIHVAIFSTDPDGVASAELLAIVDAALQADDVCLVNDTIIVSTAVRTTVNIAADIWLMPDADQDTIARAALALRTAWGAEQKLGRSLVKTWWEAKLSIAGVYKIEGTSPMVDVVPPSSEAVSIGTIDLTFKGRAY